MRNHVDDVRGPGVQSTLMTAVRAVGLVVATAGCLYWACRQANRPSISLVDACLVGDNVAVTQNLSWGADPREPDPVGNTPLHWAASSKQGVPAIGLLLDRGAEVNSRNVRGQTPLHLAALTGNADAAAELLSRSAEVDARDCRGRTPLYGAAMCGQPAVVEVLLQHGADPTLASDDGRTPLTLATSGPEVMRLLIDSPSTTPP